MRDHNIIKWRMALAKASETDFEDHCTVFAGWRNSKDEVENTTTEFSVVENCELRHSSTYFQKSCGASFTIGTLLMPL